MKSLLTLSLLGLLAACGSEREKPVSYRSDELGAYHVLTFYKDQVTYVVHVGRDASYNWGTSIKVNSETGKAEFTETSGYYPGVDLTTLKGCEYTANETDATLECDGLPERKFKRWIRNSTQQSSPALR